MPWVAIVGRPNVGKSTLFNRLTRSRRALVGNEPGITRDRLHGTAEWRGRQFGITDTGGILPESRDLIPQAILRQARTAIATAATILFVVDGRTELAAPDLQLAQMLRRSGKPVLLLVNKIESEWQDGDLAPLHRLGFEPLYPVSAEHGRGLEAPLDAVLELLPREAAEAAPEAEADETKVAIVGRPNVGKSTLLNRLAGEE
ncbi:MAG: GTPase, partial [Terriglobales bacterium]